MYSKKVTGNPSYNKRTLVMLQPGYLPWIGFFEQVYRADMFVIYDDAQYTKQDWRNRNRVKSPAGIDAYLTVPVEKCSTQTLIKDVKISNSRNWIKKHLDTLKSYYQKSKYFKEYFSSFEQILLKRHKLLIELSVELTLEIMELIGIETRIVYSSDLNTPVHNKTRQLRACKELAATHCYNGKAGMALYDPHEYFREEVIIEFQDFICPKYPQLWGTFIPNLSIVDLLFNCGPETINYVIEGGKNIVQLSNPPSRKLQIASTKSQS